MFWLLGNPRLSSAQGHCSSLATPNCIPHCSGPGKLAVLTWDSFKYKKLLPSTSGVRRLDVWPKALGGVLHPPRISSHLPKKLYYQDTSNPPLGAELSIFPAQKDHSLCFATGKTLPSTSSPSKCPHCSSARTAHRRFQSLYSR